MANISRPILTALALLILVADIAGGSANHFDAMLIRKAAEWRSAYPEFTRFADKLTYVGGAPVTLGVAAIASLTLIARRLTAAAMVIAVTVVGERLIVDQLKDWIGRPRPSLEPLWSMPQSLAFPSGHAANSMTAFLIVALVATPARWRLAAGAGAIVLALMVGMSRIYLGIHWPTDVIGGWALGLLTVGGAIEIGRRSGALPLEQKHNVIGRHLAPPGE